MLYYGQTHAWQFFYHKNDVRQPGNISLDNSHWSSWTLVLSNY